jgi:hypothetical protein
VPGLLQRGPRPLAMMELVERVLIKLPRSMRVESRRGAPVGAGGAFF